jgi:hypothetical protein
VEVESASGVVDEGLGGPSAGPCSPVAKCEGEASSESVVAACEVESASDDVERALDATHSAVALNRAQTAGDRETRNGVKEVEPVQSGCGLNSAENRCLMRRQRPQETARER